MSNPIDSLLHKLESRGCPARRSGDGWSARCPAHGDRRASLSIAEGEDGRALVHCHAGCEASDIVARLGLTLRDLMTVEDAPPLSHRSGPKALARSKDGTTYPTAKAAVESLEQRRGPRSAAWAYRDAGGEPVAVVIRWDLPDGKKDIRPVSLHEDGWRAAGMPAPRPLYRLPELAGKSRVYVVEGERCVDATRSLGLTATTSAHGAKSAAQTDWSPLAGRDVVVLPDAGEAGEKYADDVAKLLQALTPPAEVRIIRLADWKHWPAGCPIGGDICDWIEAHGDAAEPADLRRQIEAMLVAAPTPKCDSVPSPSDLTHWKPFPVDAFPEPLAGFVRGCGQAIGCDPSYVALPLLTMLASAIGNSRRLQLKRCWTVPPILWTAIVGESGTAKTPAFRHAMRPIRERQTRALAEHAEAMKRYGGDVARWERDMATWRNNKSNERPPERPLEPQPVRHTVSDTTIEALAPILRDNPRGIMVDREELAGWFGSFDQYRGGRGSADSAQWLSMHSGEGITVDRKTGQPRTIHVPSAAVCICGGIQPAILARVLGQEHRESGMLARFLLASPPRQAKRWVEADIDPNLEAAIDRVLNRLYELLPETSETGVYRPVVLQLTSEAHQLWRSFFNDHAKEQVEMDGDLSAAWSKLEECPARLALVLHCVRWAANDPTLTSADLVDLASMRSAIRLTEWFKFEARRIYAMLVETEDGRRQRKLVEWIERKGRTVTIRDLSRGPTQYRTPGAAEAALQSLVAAGLGEWIHLPTSEMGGRPTSAFRLYGPSDGDRTLPKPKDEPSSVAVAAETADSKGVDHVNLELGAAAEEWEEECLPNTSDAMLDI